MPSVTSLRTAYFTCWIGPGRCVRASLNSGLICKSPTTRSKLIKSRMPNRPMSGLQRVAASETHINVLRAERRPKSPPQADTDPTSSPDAHASNANGRATETPTDAKAAANSEAKSNPTSVKPSQAHLVAPPPGRSLSIQYTNGYVYLGRPVPFTAGRVTRGKERERKKETNKHREPLISTRATCSGYRVYPPHPPPPWRPARGRPRLSPAGRTARCSTATARRPPRA